MEIGLGIGTSSDLTRGAGNVLQALVRLGGLTFYKNYSGSPSSLNADYSLGAPTATFTRDDVACTYVDVDGVIQSVSTENVPRIASGYYDATGFHAIAKPGIMIEAATTNRATYSGTPENAAWTKTNITADNDDAGSSSPDGVATANRLLATAANGTFVQAYPITGDAKTYTASVYIKRKTGTGKIYLGAVEDGTEKAEITVTSGWTRHSVTATTDGDDAGKDPAFYLEIETDTDAVYIYGMQLELGPYPTSYVPSPAGTALTRGAETLKYAIAGNRTAAAETIAIKFMPLGGSFANDGVTRYLIHNADDMRHIRKAQAYASSFFTPNRTDEAAVQASQADAINVNTSYVFVGVCQHSSPYVSLYIDNDTPGTYTDGDWTTNDLPTDFYIGSYHTGIAQLNGIIQEVDIFGREASADVSAITALMNL